MANILRNRFQTIAIVLLFSTALSILPNSSSAFSSQYSEKVDTNEFLTGFEGQPFNEVENLEKFIECSSSSHFPITIALYSEISQLRNYSFSHSIPNYLSQPPPPIS